jgi:hypothetical protein
VLWDVLNYNADPTKVAFAGGNQSYGRFAGQRGAGQIIDDAKRIDKSYSPGVYESVQRARNEWNMSGQTGRQINSLNTSVNHLGELTHAAAALNNGDYTAWNSIVQRYAAATGQPQPTSFATAAKLVGDEVAKFISGSGSVAEGTKEEIAANFSRAGSPQQLQAAIRETAKLLAGKADPLAVSKQRDFGNRKKESFETLLNDETRTTYKKIMNNDINTPEGRKAWGVEGKPEPQGQPDSAHIEMLKKDPTPLRRQQFDDVYGKGAAAKVLGG